VAALIEECGFVLVLAIESHVTSVVDLVVLQVTSCPRLGLSSTDFQVDEPVPREDQTRS